MFVRTNYITGLDYVRTIGPTSRRDIVSQILK